jgi:predicted permease
MEFLLRDLRHGTRALLKSPALTAVAVLALTIGIGLTTMMFSIVYGAIMRGLPFEDGHRIMHAERNNLARDIESMEVTAHDFADWRAQQRSFEALAGFYTGTVNLSGGEKPERFDGAFVSANMFDVLRVRPLLGPGFRPGDDEPGAPPVAVLGYELWQTRFNGDPDIIGKTVRANGAPREIVGVMPERFEFPIDQEIWLALDQHPSKLKRGEGWTLEVVGRLRDGVLADEAAVELNAIAKRLALEYPATNEGVGAVVKPFIDEYIDEEPRMLLYTMLGAVVAVLLIACANVANLLLGRAAHRSKEVGIRTALGASRWIVVRQFLAESMILSIAGAVLGTGMAALGVKLFNDAIAPTNPPFWIDIKLDLPILLFVLAVAVVSSLASGLIPALQASRVDINEILKDESRGASSFRLGRMSRGLVVFEIALSCGLLVGAGLMVKSVTKLRTIDFGFDVDHVFTARVGLPEPDYPTDTVQVRFYEELERRLTNLPGTEMTALTTAIPVTGFGGGDNFALDGAVYQKPQDYPDARIVAVSPSFFPIFDARARQGRLFGEEDRATSLPVVIINESFARRYFKDGNPVGRRIRFGGAESTAPWRTVVGVVPDLWASGVDNDEPEAMYVPLSQRIQRFVSIVARTPGAPMEITPRVRDIVTSIDPDLPIYFVNSMRGAIAQNTWFYRVFGSLFMVFGFFALFLAAIGLYAVMAFSVGRRTREMGVRMALGAQGADVVRLIFRQGIVQIGIGLGLGLALAAGVSNLLQMILFEVQPRDPVIFGSVAVVLAAAGLAACLVPARRATKVDPLVALRAE